MDERQPPQSGGNWPSLRQTMPTYMNTTGDLIDEQTLLLRCKKNAAGITPNLPSNPFTISMSIKEAIDADPTKLLTAIKEARGAQYVIRTSSKSVVEKLLNMGKLTDGTEVEVTYHPTLNIVQGVIHDVDTVNMKEEELLEKLNAQNIVSIRRITKLVENVRVNTPLLVLSFSGSFLPPFVYLGIVRVSVRQYYKSPLQCFKCGHFGHSSKFCSQSEVCLNCAENHETIPTNPCREPSKCVNCQGNHPSRFKKCPVYEREVNIIRVKTDQNITFAEARAMLNATRNQQTYANITQANIIDEKDQTIAMLRQEVQQLQAGKITQTSTISRESINFAKEIQALRQEIQQLRANFSPQPNTSTIDPEKTQLRKELDDAKAVIKKLITEMAAIKSSVNHPGQQMNSNKPPPCRQRSPVVSPKEKRKHSKNKKPLPSTNTHSDAKAEMRTEVSSYFRKEQSDDGPPEREIPASKKPKIVDNTPEGLFDTDPESSNDSQ